MSNNIIIVIPTYNAREGIVENILKVQAKAPQATIIIVDDNSPDKTAQLIKENFGKDNRVQVLIRKKKGGRGSAVLHGFKEGLKNKDAKFFIEIDADLCHNPKYIKQLVEKCKKADVVIASRYINESKITGWNMKRKLMSLSINAFAKILLRVPISDYTDGFRCYSRKAIEFISSHQVRSRGYIVLSEVAYLCYKKGLKFAEVPINFHFEAITKSNLDWREVSEALGTIIWLRLKPEEIIPIIKNKKNPFRIEELRADLAKIKDYRNLKKAYSNVNPEIRDFNTPGLWDGLNTRGVRGKNPMDDDRINIVSKLIKGKQIINVGFGSASLEKKYFKNHHRDVAWNGIDISPASVKKAKKEFPNAKFQVGNILNLQYENNSFDTVVSLEVLEHIKPKNTFKALNEIFRIVKPGGYFIISVPLNEGLEELIARGENPSAHVRAYTPELIKAELEIVGFKILKEKKLFAFHKFYKLKTGIAKLLPAKFKPNNIIVLAQKSI